MEFFDKLGKKASEAYKFTADKTGKIAKETKNKIKMNDLKSQINDIFEEMGKKIYEQHLQEENIDVEGFLAEKCTEIDKISAEIEKLLKECLDLKDKKKCPNCHAEIDKGVKFCPHCGAKQDDEPEKKSAAEQASLGEQAQDNSSENTDDNKPLENQIEITDSHGDNQYEEDGQNDNQENLEKTVQVESHPDSNLSENDVNIKTDFDDDTHNI